MLHDTRYVLQMNEISLLLQIYPALTKGYGVGFTSEQSFGCLQSLVQDQPADVHLHDPGTQVFCFEREFTHFSAGFGLPLHVATS